MPRRAEVLSRIGAPALLVGLGALLPLLLPGAGTVAELLRLLWLFLLLPILAVLSLEAAPGRRLTLPSRIGLLALATAAAVLVTARRAGLDAADLALWSAGPLLVALAALGAAHLAGARRFAALAGLALPAAAVFLPFLADSWIARTSDPIRLQAGLDLILRLTPWPGACDHLLGVDLFKNEGLYREFLLGEQLYALPGARPVLAGQAGLALGVLALGGSLRLLRRLLARVLSPNSGCASIPQP